VISLDIDVPLSMFFAVEIEGEVNSGFKTATGLGTRTREYVIRQGNAEDIALPIGHEPGTVTLTAGYAFSDLLWEWSEKVHKWQRGDKDPRRAVSIIQLYKPQHPLALEIGPMPRFEIQREAGHPISHGREARNGRRCPEECGSLLAVMAPF
jgi:hypothetical protein